MRRGSGGRKRRGAFAAAAVAALLQSVLSACAEPSGGPRLYVTSGFTDEVLILDPRSGRILDRRTLDLRPGERDEPHGVAVSPSGRHWYATLAHGEPSLWKFETEGDRLVGRLGLPIRGASRVALDPDGRRAVIPDYWLGGLGAPSDVALVSLETLEIVTVLEVCPAPHHAAWDPEGRRIAVTCSLSDEIVVLDADATEVVARFSALPAPADAPADAPDTPATRPGNPLARPMNLAWAPDGRQIYVSLMRAGRIGAYGPGGEIFWTAAVGDSPAQIAVTPDGSLVVAANRGDGTLALVDAATGRSRALPLPEALHPHGVALAPDGDVAWVTWEGSTTSEGGVLAVDLRDGEVLWRTRAGVYTLGVAVLP